MKLIFVGALFCVVCLAGCTVLESAVGIKRDAAGNVTHDGTGGAAGVVLNYVLPGLGTLVAAAATWYAKRQRDERQQSEAANIATFRGIEAYEDPKLKKHIASYHVMAHVQDFVSNVLTKEGINQPPTAPAGG